MHRKPDDHDDIPRRTIIAQTVLIPSTTGGSFACDVVIPRGDAPTSAVVLASAVHGVDADIRALADELIYNEARNEVIFIKYLQG